MEEPGGMTVKGTGRDGNGQRMEEMERAEEFKKLNISWKEYSSTSRDYKAASYG